MLKHIVMFRFHEEFREEAISIAMEKLYGLKDQIDVIRSMEIGRDVVKRPHSFDIVLTIEFDSLEDYIKYDEHPAHVAVKEYLALVRSGLAAVDFLI